MTQPHRHFDACVAAGVFMHRNKIGDKMKIHKHDTRRVHRITSFDCNTGEHIEDVTFGDVRSVTVGLEPGEVPDIMSNSAHRASSDTLMRPDHVELRWQRHTHWGFGIWGNTGWNRNHETDDWVLEVARIAGPNVRKDGSIGQQNRAVFHRWECHTRAPLDRMPVWFAELVSEHDPNRTGSLLDREPVPA